LSNQTRADDSRPARRLLIETAKALRARQGLPRRDPRRASSMWLRPNWPTGLLLGPHREHLVDALAADPALRQEVRARLGLGSSPAISDARADGGGGRPVANAGERLAIALTMTADPRSVLEAAAVDPDPAIAAAAAPYLNGRLPVPAPRPEPAATAPAMPALALPAADKLRSQLRAARDRVRGLGKELRSQQQEAAQLRRDLSAATARAETAEATAAQLRAQVPSRRQRAALSSAGEWQDKTDHLQRKLDRERAAHQTELRRVSGLLSEAEEALASAQADADTERRARYLLDADLGADPAGRARRLVTLTDREAARLRRLALDMPDGPRKSRSLKRVQRLDDLTAILGELYDLGPATASAAPSAAELDGENPSGQLVPVVHARPRGLIVTPIGGADTIGGSSLLVQAGDTRILIDAGLKPNTHTSGPGPDNISEATRQPIDALIITHAHADHAGYVPWVIEQQRRTQILCSPETMALLPTVWADSVKVMRAEAETRSAPGEPAEPCYGDAEVSQAEDRLRAVRYGSTVNIGETEVTLFRAGHILGAAGVIIRAGAQRVVITGDIDDRGQASVGPALIPPGLASGADLLVIETTYGDRLHPDRQQEGEGLVRRAEEVLEAGGRILIPAFGLGRAQEIALLAASRLPDVDVLVDGLAATISELYARNGAPPVLGGRVRKVVNREREIRGFQEGLIVTTSGMLTGGAAIPWAQAILPDPRNALFLCGHQDEDAPGYELQQLADADPDQPRKVRLRDDHGKPIDVDVAASVYRYNLSAHADRNGLASIVGQVRPRSVMLVHGERGPQAHFRARLNASGYLVADNRQAWDQETVTLDTRTARLRYGSRAGGRR
jgi:Cft2 family RNA processing exonuclease/cell division septum initiation protein DivIVA